MPEKRSVLKDFIYLDVERLYSLYSQLFEGVVSNIVKSFESSREDGDKQRGPAANEVEQRVFELSRLTENRFLYDHMFTRLEEKLGQGIVDVSMIDATDLRNVTENAFLVKAKGAAEIEDFTRLRLFLNETEKLAESIGYAIAVNLTNAEQFSELWQNTKGIRDKQERKRVQQEVAAKDPQKLSKQIGRQLLGPGADSTLRENLGFWIDMFYKDGFDVTVYPSQDATRPAYRSPLDRRWLRVSPELIRARFGTYAEGNWWVVGHVTHIPGFLVPAAVAVPDEASEDDQPSMRDPIRNLARATSSFERMFLESKQRMEIVLCPVAIYREYALPDTSEERQPAE